MISASVTGHRLFSCLIMAFYSVQYLVLPVLILINGHYSWTGYNSEITRNIMNASLLQSLVIFCVTLYLILGKRTKVQLKEWSTNTEVFFTKKSKWLVLIMVILSIGFLIAYPQLLLKFRLVVYSDTVSYYAFSRRGFRYWPV